MIKEIKAIVKNYLDNAKLTQLTVGTVETVNPLTIRLNEKLVIPTELITGNLKKSFTETKQIGKRLRLIRNHGGQEFYILEVIEDASE